MAILLIPFSLFLQTALFGRKNPRESFLKAAVVIGLTVFFSTECLSLGRLLYFGPLLGAWLAVLAAQAALFLIKGRQKDVKLPVFIFEPTLISAAAIAAVCLLVCFLAAPNNFDSMTYHLPRVMHWAQDRSVDYFPTNDLRLLAMPPGAAYAMLQAYLLSGSDCMMSTVQWLAFVGSLFGVYELAARLGAGKGGRILAAALCASIPMAVLQAETTQNDLLTAFWLVCQAVFALKDGEYHPRDLLWMSAALGLGVLAKPTALVFGAPLLLIVIARVFRRAGPTLSEEAVVRGVGSAGLVLALSLSLSAGFLARNKRALGAWLPDDGRTIKASVDLRRTASCALKNAALNVPLPFIWRAALGIERRVLRLDPEDPGNNFEPAATRTLNSLCRKLVIPDEDFVGSPVHFALIVWALWVLGAALVREREDPWSDRVAMAVGLLAGFLIYSAFFKWQEWANRLLLPLFILAAPLTAQILEDKLTGEARKVLLVFLAGSGLLYAATATARPLIALPARLTTQWQTSSILTKPAEQAYFEGYARVGAKPLRAVLETLAKDKCGYLGLSLVRNDWEYPWWALTRGAGVRIKNVNVRNSSKDLPPEFPSEKLCGVVESQGGVMMYFDAADMGKMHAAGNHEPPLISDIKKE